MTEANASPLPAPGPTRDEIKNQAVQAAVRECLGNGPLDDIGRWLATLGNHEQTPNADAACVQYTINKVGGDNHLQFSNFELNQMTQTAYTKGGRGGV